MNKQNPPLSKRDAEIKQIIHLLHNCDDKELQFIKKILGAWITYTYNSRKTSASAIFFD